jgi:hypothetical protein
MPVRALLHYALEVPDQAVGETFYRTFGLIDQPARDGAVHLHPGGVGRACTLDFIPEECARVPRDFPEEDSLYVWGPPLPPEFVENTELA